MSQEPGNVIMVLVACDQRHLIFKLKWENVHDFSSVVCWAFSKSTFFEKFLQQYHQGSNSLDLDQA